MKRLSLNNDSECKSFVLPYSLNALIFNNEGSYIKTDEYHKEIGVCISCTNKYCFEFSEKELETPSFKSFPHNTSRRVCPTKAIYIDKSNGSANINSKLCIACGLCVHRCPTAAIQFDFDNNICSINTEHKSKSPCEIEQQKKYIETIVSTPHLVFYDHIPAAFGAKYQYSISTFSKHIPDISEIIVRNTLLNMGICCNVTAAGNNHIRIEFFGQQGEKVIIGESNSKDTDTLTVLRRILDDEAVMIGRYRVKKENITPLSVINGFPNKRTDYYEVVNDIKNVLDIQICTITFHVLFILNLFNIKLNIEDFGSFVINRDLLDLVPYVERFIPNLRSIDESIPSINYEPIK